MAIFSAKLSGQLLAAWCRQVGNALNAGLSILSIMESEAMRPTVKRVSQRVWNDVVEALQSGSTLAGALRRREEYFPELFISMVEVGEKAGNLGEILLELADFYEQLLKLRKTFMLSLIWPIIQIIIVILVIGLVILIQGALNFDMLGLGITGFSGFLKYLAFLGVIGITCFAAYLWLRNNLTRSRWIVGILDRIPKIGTVFRTFAISRLTRSMHLTMKTGMDIYEALELSFRSAAYPPISRYYTQIKTILSTGGTIFEAFRSCRIFSDLVLMELHVAEETGTIPESMGRIADEYFEESILRAKTLTLLGGVAVGLFVAGIIIFFIFRLAFFYIGMIQSAGQI